MPKFFVKDPDAKLDYKIDWEDWLEDGETIDSFELIDFPSGLTNHSAQTDISADELSVIVWISGGTVGETYCITCRIVSSGGRTDDRTIRIRIEDK